ncbi:hypothetical protein INR49_027620 [Caranx melampygus]|nr:hypothetical protein INR49_027620 [Caranx melampygus]
MYLTADGDVLDYKQLAALPRVKAIYDIQRPDIIPYQADHAHTHLSDDTLERYSCGQSLGSLSPYSHAVRVAGVHPITVSQSPASEETNIYRKPPIYKRHDVSASPTANKSKTNENLINSCRLSSSNCNSIYHPGSNYYPYTGSPKVSRVRRFSSGGEEDGWNHNINKGIGRLILKEEMKARSGCHDNDQWGSRRSSRCSSKEALNNLGYGSLNGSPRSVCSADSGECVLISGVMLTQQSTFALILLIPQVLL